MCLAQTLLIFKGKTQIHKRNPCPPPPPTLCALPKTGALSEPCKPLLRGRKAILAARLLDGQTAGKCTGHCPWNTRKLHRVGGGGGVGWGGAQSGLGFPPPFLATPKGLTKWEGHVGLARTCREAKKLGRALPGSQAPPTIKSPKSWV